MKKYIIPVFAALAVLSACQEKATDLMGITYYADIQLKGDNPYIISVGGSYTDPGFTAILLGEDVSSQVVVDDSEVDPSTMGIYSVYYTHVNEDGIPVKVSREVCVANPGHVDNLYFVTSTYGARTYTFPMAVTEVSSGVYAIDDWFGGFYCLGRYPGYEAYGYNFWAAATFRITDTNTIELVDYDDSWYFAASFDEEPTDSGYDPATGEIFWTIEDSFYVTLVPLG